MCRLFGLTAGTTRVAATFWLIDAPDSMEAQSHRNADGSGIGTFSAGGQPVLDKQPEPAYQAAGFRRAAVTARSATFIAHVRFATAGGRSAVNTHPFAQAGRVMAHNGGFGDLELLDAELGEYRDLVQGDTDSERYFALITRETDIHGGDVGAGLAGAARWIAARLPVSSLNAIITTPDELWALRYPGQHALHVIERPAGRSEPARSEPARSEPAGAVPAGAPAAAGASAAAGTDGLHARSSLSSVHAPELELVPTVVVASERLDGETGWRMLAPGELLHVRPDLSVESVLALPDPPARLVPLPPGSLNIDS